MSFRSSLDAKPPSKSTILVLLCMYIYIYSILRTVIVLTPLFPAPSLPQGHVFRIANTQPHSTRRDMHPYPFPLLANNRTIRHGPPHHASRMLMAPRSALIIHATHTEEISSLSSILIENLGENEFSFPCFRFDFVAEKLDQRRFLIVRIVNSLYIEINYLIFKRVK